MKGKENWKFKAQNLEVADKKIEDFKINIWAVSVVLVVSILYDLIYRESYLGYHPLLASLILLLIILIALLIANFDRLSFVNGQVVSIWKYNGQYGLNYMVCSWKRFWIPKEISLSFKKDETELAKNGSRNTLRISNSARLYNLSMDLFETKSPVWREFTSS